MNAIPPSPSGPEKAARTARHLAMLEELAEMGMALARAIGQHALATLEASVPEAPDAVPPTRKSCDPGLAFARVACAVRQAIALEARIIADRDAPPRSPRPPHPDRNADPRRAKIRRVLREIAEAETDAATAATLHREIDERIEDELEADPGQEIPFEQIVAALCEDLDLALDLSRQSDEVLAILSRAWPPGSADDPAADPPAAPVAPAPAPQHAGPDPPA